MGTDAKGGGRDDWSSRRKKWKENTPDHPLSTLLSPASTLSKPKRMLGYSWFLATLHHLHITIPPYDPSPLSNVLLMRLLALQEIGNSEIDSRAAIIGQGTSIFLIHLPFFLKRLLRITPRSKKGWGWSGWKGTCTTSLVFAFVQNANYSQNSLSMLWAHAKS